MLIFAVDSSEFFVSIVQYPVDAIFCSRWLCCSPLLVSVLAQEFPFSWDISLLIDIASCCSINFSINLVISLLVIGFPVGSQSCFILADDLSSSGCSGVVIAHTDAKLFLGLSCRSSSDDSGKNLLFAGSMTDLGLFITPLLIREVVGNGIFSIFSFSIRSWSCRLVSSEGADTLLIFSVSSIVFWSRSADSTPVAGGRRSSDRV